MSTKIATLLVRNLPHYRFEAFHKGLTRHGYTVTLDPQRNPSAGGVLVVWNRHGHNDVIAKRYEAAGARVIVAENGYIGIDEVGHHLFALSLDQHNGRGRFPTGDGERWTRLGIELAPWRQDGKHVLVLPQRGIGSSSVAMPLSWPNNIMARLRHVTRPVRLRPHPGKNKDKVTPLADDLADAWVAVVWGSSAGLKALAAGVPVVSEMPGWIGEAAAGRVSDIDAPVMPDRLPVFQRLAWAQWTAAEIETGLAFDHLLQL